MDAMGLENWDVMEYFLGGIWFVGCVHSFVWMSRECIEGAFPKA